MTAQDAIRALWTASIAIPIDLKTDGTRDIVVALDLSLSGISLHLKTKSYHWHMSGAHSGKIISWRSHHKLIDSNAVDGAVTSLRGNSRNSSIRDTSSVQITAPIDVR
jgi:hypothetical protein